MTTTSWAHGVSGDFDDMTKWTADHVPVAGDTALIEAHGSYTVTSSQLNTLADLEMAKTATLDIADHHMVIASGTGSGALAGTIDVMNDTALVLGTASSDTTFKNTGTINVQSGIESDDNAKLQVTGTVTLTGNGDVVLSGFDAVITAASTDAGTLINGSKSSASTISGTGAITDVGAAFAFTNSAKGVIDGNDPAGLTIDLDRTNNSGILEATGEDGILNLEGDIEQTAKGLIKAVQGGSQVDLSDSGPNGEDNALIDGGELFIGKGSFFESVGDPTGIENIIGTSTKTENKGTLQADSGTLLIEANVDNVGTLVAQAGSVLQVVGASTGGQADVDSGGEIQFFDDTGPKTTTNVTFEGGGGILHLTKPADFTGTVTGNLTGGAGVQLGNIAFADNPTLSYNSSRQLLTVTDSHSGVTDTIKIVGTTMFAKTDAVDGTGQVVITGAGPGSPSAPQNSLPLLTQSMASFGASGGVAPSGATSPAGHHGSSDFLTASAAQGHQ